MAHPLLREGDWPWADGVTTRPCEVRISHGRRLMEVRFFTYDAQGRLVTRLVTRRVEGERPHIGQESMRYAWEGDRLLREYRDDEFGLPATLEVPMPFTLPDRARPTGRFDYDSAGRVTEIRSSGHGFYRYRWSGGLPVEIVEADHSDGPARNTVTMRYDPEGHLIERAATRHDGRTSTDSYRWEGGRLVGARLASGQEVEIVWDDHGRILEMRSGEDVTRHRYDRDGHLMERVRGAGTGRIREQLRFGDCPADPPS